MLAFTYRAGRFLVHVSSEASSAVTGVVAGDSQTVGSEAFLQFVATMTGPALQVAGQVDSLVVTPSRLSQAGSGFVRLLLPLRFTALLQPNGHAIMRVGADSSGGCWSEARTVLDPLYAVFPAVPSPLHAGARWRDSVEITTCRLGIAVRVREVRELVLDRITSGDGVRLGSVSYSAFTQASGTRSDRGATVTYLGTGESHGTLVLDAIAGVVQRDESAGTYRVVLRVDGVERALVQRGRRVIEVVPRN